jgi:hypothetical protein
MHRLPLPDSAQADTDAAYEVCPVISRRLYPAAAADLDCADIRYRNFRALWNVPDTDPHHFDGNRDGIGCQS